MRLIGLTGGIASGKSTVSERLRELGAVLIDADAVYHDLVRPNRDGPSALARQIETRFPGVLHADGSLDRATLGARVFGVPEELEALGRITHPAVAGEVARRVAEFAERGVGEVVYDVPLLFERGLEAMMHAVVVVWVPRPVQIERLRARDGITAEAAARKIDSQRPLDEKRARANYVIDNSGARVDTLRQVDALWRELHVE